MPRSRLVHSHSVDKILAGAYEDGLRRVSEILKAWAGLPDDTRPSIQKLKEQYPVVSRTIELEGWLFPDRDDQKRREQRATRMTEEFDKIRAPFDVTDTMRKVILRQAKGARTKPEMRRLAKRALEAKRQKDPKFSLMRFTLSHCPCPKRPHDLKCRERIRQGVMKLEKLIKSR